jgi:hypothetical protein
MACRCQCCEKTGACCTEEGCTEETCADCNDLGGVFQGVGTVCAGEDDDECPCDPPAEPAECQKCVDGEAVSYCPEDRPYCCDGACQAEPCEEAECDFGACCGPDTLFGQERLVCRDINVFTILTKQQCLDEGGLYYDCTFCVASSDTGPLGCLDCGPVGSDGCEDPP